VGELCCSLAHRAKHALGLSSVADAHPGAVCAVQRTDGALRLNVHLHVLALDGVYVRDAGSQKLEFHALATPTRAEVQEVCHRTAERVEKLLRKQAVLSHTALLRRPLEPLAAPPRSCPASAR
jgi:hypothetical protein